MSFLKKLGSAILGGISIVTGFQPVVQSINPRVGSLTTTVTSDLALVAAVIGQVEAMGQALALPGAQKLTAAAPLVAQVIMQSSLMTGKKINDEVLFQKACSEIAGGMADLLNSLHEQAVQVDKLT